MCEVLVDAGTDVKAVEDAAVEVLEAPEGVAGDVYMVLTLKWGGVISCGANRLGKAAPCPWICKFAASRGSMNHKVSRS